MGFCRRSEWNAGSLRAAFGLSLIAASVAVSAAQDVTEPGKRIIPQVTVENAPLQAAVSLLRAQTGIDIILMPSDKPYGLVTVALNDKPLETVLRLMAQSAGAIVKYDSGVFMIGPKEAFANQPVAEPARNEPAEPVFVPKRARWERIRLNQSTPSELLKQIGAYGGTEPIAEILKTSVLREQLKGLSNLPASGLSGLGIQQPRMLGPADTNNSRSEQVPPVVPTGAPVRNGENRQEGQIGGGFGGGGRGGGGGLGGGGGGFGGGQGGGLGGGLGGGGLGGGLGGGQGGNQAANLLPAGIDAVIAYDVDNTIIVRYTDEDGLRELKEIVRLLDIAPKQLMIRAEFIEVRQDDLRSFGIDWQIARGALTASTFEGAYAQGDIVVNYATGNMVAALRTSLVEGKGRIVNSPMATTTNNVPVTISIGTTVPVITTSVVFGNQGGGITVPQIVPVQVVSGLLAVPRINGDGSISMFVTPFIQDIVSEVANPAGGSIPIISTQFVPVVRRIGNNETMVIGGLIKKNDRSSVKKVPLFADLPLIGGLFRSTSTTISDSELLVFITPTILPDPVSQPIPGTSVGTGGGVGAIRP